MDATLTCKSDEVLEKLALSLKAHRNYAHQLVGRPLADLNELIDLVEDQIEFRSCSELGDILEAERSFQIIDILENYIESFEAAFAERAEELKSLKRYAKELT